MTTKEFKQLQKSILTITKGELLTKLQTFRESMDTKTELNKAAFFAELLFNCLMRFSKEQDFITERIILNHLIDLALLSQSDKRVIRFLAMSISQIIVDSRPIRGKKRTVFFFDLLEILTRFPEEKQIFEAISAAAIELIKWGNDSEILEILEIMQEKAAYCPLIESIQLLDAKVFLNTLFYLSEQNCDRLFKIYRQFSSFAISNFEFELEPEGVATKVKSSLKGEDVNEILQEGAINAIINLARTNKKEKEKNCLLYIRRILQDAEYLLRQQGKVLFAELYRLSYALDQFKLWDEFLDIPLIQELKEERDKNIVLQEAEAKMLAIIKTMRIEEYDALKIGRRGIVLAYNLKDIQDIKAIYQQITCQKLKTFTPIKIVEEVDAIIDYDVELKEHLRDIGEIPTDRQTINEIQDKISLRDDLTVAATKESNIVNQVEFLKKLHHQDKRFLEKHLLHTLALIYAVGMHGFKSPVLNIQPEELILHINALCEKKLILEIIEPLIRAVTLRAARFDGKAVVTLLQILNQKGLKFLEKYYQQYNFVDNIIRLISFYGRRGENELLVQIKEELETANHLTLNEEEIPLKIARAINEGILSYEAKNQAKKIALLQLNEEIAKVHSYDEKIQIKYLEALNFLILDFPHLGVKNLKLLSEKLVEFIRLYSKQQEIVQEGAIGLLFLLGIAQVLQDKPAPAAFYRKELEKLSKTFPENQFLLQIKRIATNDRRSSN